MQIVIKDKTTGNAIFDLDRSLDTYTGLTFSSEAPGGYASCSFTLTKRFPFNISTIKENQIVKVYDGQKLVYFGDIVSIAKSTNGTLKIDCQGRQWIFGKRFVRKIWVSNTVFPESYDPNENIDTDEKILTIQRGRNYVKVGLGGVDTRISGEDIDDYRVETHWDSQGAGFVRRVTGTQRSRTGEGGRLIVYNVGQAATEGTYTHGPVTVSNQSVDETFTGGDTEIFSIIIGPSDNNAEYTDDDWTSAKDFTVEMAYESGHSVSTPNYYADEVAEDVLRRAGILGVEINSTLSMASPNLALKPFGGFSKRTVAQYLDLALSYGDTSNNQYYWFVFGPPSGAILPTFVIEQRDTTDYDYWIDGDDNNVELDFLLSSDELTNYVSVEYTNSDGNQVVRTPGDNASLKDTTSISDNYRLDAWLDINEGTNTLADEIGENYLVDHGTRRLKGKATVYGKVRLKRGAGKVPVSWVRSGQRAYIVQYDTTIYIGQVRVTEGVSGKPDSVEIIPDEPPDELSMLLSRRKLVAEQ